MQNIDYFELCEKLVTACKNGRNDYPVRVMLNLIYAMKIFGHRSVESFRRELSRNSGLRKLCGLKEEDYLYTGKRRNLVPPARVLSNFFSQLIKYQKDLVEKFGVDCAIDGKIIPMYTKKINEDNPEDKRAEHDADYTAKTYHFEDGKKKTTWYFGFNAHILCCAKYGLPIHKKVLPTNISEQKVLDQFIEELSISNPKILSNMENLMAEQDMITVREINY